MATPRVSDNPEVQSHYALQLGVTASLVAALRRLWRLVDLGDVSGSLPAYKTAVAAVVNQYGLASASFGSDYFDTMRAQAGVTAPFRTPLVDPAPDAQVQASLGWATSDLTGPSAPTITGDDLATTVQAKVEGVSQKLVTDAGRNELIAAIEADKEATGWARVTKPGACAFCRMLATRGAVYRSAETAKFEAHDKCHCTIQPLFGHHYEPPAHTRADMALYREVTKGKSDKLNAFRRAVYAQQQP